MRRVIGNLIRRMAEDLVPGSRRAVPAARTGARRPDHEEDHEEERDTRSEEQRDRERERGGA